MPKILLVEDNELNRDMLLRRLQRRDYQVVLAFDGQQGVAAAHSEAPDLILMDMTLPVLDGWEATRLLKSASDTQFIPVIALTAHAMAGDREKALEAGCDEYETKPVDLPRLLDKIQTLLARPKKLVEAQANQTVCAADLKRDLLTLLNQIIGYSEMLQELGDDLPKTTYISDIKRIEISGKQMLLRLNEISVADLANSQSPPPVVQEPPEVVSNQPEVEVIQPVEAVKPNIKKSSTLTSEQNLLAKIPTLVERTIQGYILVVDDNEANRGVLNRRLERQGHTLAFAEDGLQALEVVESNPPDLILLDIMMPELDGYQTLERLKADDRWRHIPVIMISALDQIESVVKCIEMGAEDYLPKPFDPIILKARINACLEKKLLRDQEVEYLQQVELLTEAAAAVEAKRFQPESLSGIVGRNDSLGQLARVFQNMAREIYSREQRLKQQVDILRLAIDEAKKSKIVSEIAETDHFQELKKRAKKFREKV